MAPTPAKTCTACGKPVADDDKACKACGAMLGARASGFSLDDDPAPTPAKAPSPPPPAPPPPPSPPPAPPPPRAEEPEPELEWEDETAGDAPAEDAPPAAEAETPATDTAPKGETVRMSLADATQAWLEDAPTTTAVMDEVIDDVPPPRSSRVPLLIALGVLIAAAIALAMLM